MSTTDEANPQPEPPAPVVPQDKPAAAEPAEKTKLDKWMAKLRWEAYWLLPNLISPPNTRDAAFHDARDKENNSKSRIPAEAELCCSMIWGVELYGPSEIESLYDSIKKLGWNRVGARNPEDNAVDRIRQQRSNGPGGWLNIGSVLTQGTRESFSMTHNYAPLPDGVKSLSVRVFQITSSLTAVLVGFQLADPHVSHYQRETDRDRKTFYRRSVRPQAIEWVEPWHQKEEAVREGRSELRGIIGSWFSWHLPGYFCESGRPSEFPTMELLIAQGPILEQPEKAAARSWEDWRRLLANVPPHEIWTYEADPGLQLAFERQRDAPKGLHILAALDTQTFPKEKVQPFGGDKPSAYGWLCDETLGGILVHSATVEYLKENMQDLNLTRERMKKARSARKHVALTLDEIGDFFDRMLGSSVIARELAKHSKEVSWYRHDCANFTAPGWKNEDRHKLHERICGQVSFLSSQLADEEAALRDHFEQLSTVLSVRESIRAQHRMEWLTVLALVVALASLVIALPALDETKKQIGDFWRSAISAMHK